MSAGARERQADKVWDQFFGAKSRPSIEYDSETLGFAASAVQRAVHKVTRNGTLDLGPGQFESLFLDRDIEVLSREAGTIQSTVRVHVSRCAALKGVVIRPAPGEVALSIEAGTLICEDCTILGTVRVAAGARLFLSNARVASEGPGISLEGEAEISASRISGAPAGLFASPNTACAFFNCRIESCHGDAGSETGAGVYAESASIHAEGCEFFANQVGVYLKTCGETTLQACHFLANTTAALITEDAQADKPLRVTGCLFDSAGERGCAPVALRGGLAVLAHSRISSRGAPALSTSGVTVRAEKCRFQAAGAPALDLQGGSFSGSSCTVMSWGASGILADGVAGELTGGSLYGEPLVAGANAGNLRIAPDVAQMPLDESDSPESAGPTDPDDLDSVLGQISGLIGQPGAKEEFSRMLRLAFAARQRRKSKLPPGELKLSAAFVGPPGSGKTHAARVLAEALHNLGELPSSEVVEVSIEEALAGGPTNVSAGILIIGTEPSEGLSLTQPGVPERLLATVREVNGRSLVVLDGEREPVLAVLRAFPELAREFPFTVPFTGFGPPELAALFRQLGSREGIRLSLDARRALSVIMHGLHDRLQLRFAGTGGVAEIFEQARHNYFERCTKSQRFDLEMETEDLAVPVDRATASVIERCADMVCVCPSCAAENPWVPGLVPFGHCLQCGEPLAAEFGVWRPSSYYRKLRGRKPGLKSGAVAMRKTLADVLKRRTG